MRPVFPLHLVDIDEFDVGFVDEGGGVEGMVGAYFAQAGVGQLAELGVDEGDELVESLALAAAPFEEDAGDVGLWEHGGSLAGGCYEKREGRNQKQPLSKVLCPA